MCQLLCVQLDTRQTDGDHDADVNSIDTSSKTGSKCTLGHSSLGFLQLLSIPVCFILLYIPVLTKITAKFGISTSF